jgi:hypothetical protein
MDMILLGIALTALWCLCGVGTISLVRNTMEDFPKVLGVLWPVWLIFAAVGLFDSESK